MRRRSEYSCLMIKEHRTTHTAGQRRALACLCTNISNDDTLPQTKINVCLCKEVSLLNHRHTNTFKSLSGDTPLVTWAQNQAKCYFSSSYALTMASSLRTYLPPDAPPSLHDSPALLFLPLLLPRSHSFQKGSQGRNGFSTS